MSHPTIYHHFQDHCGILPRYWPTVKAALEDSLAGAPDALSQSEWEALDTRVGDVMRILQPLFVLPLPRPTAAEVQAVAPAPGGAGGGLPPPPHPGGSTVVALPPPVPPPPRPPSSPVAGATGPTGTIPAPPDPAIPMESGSIVRSARAIGRATRWVYTGRRRQVSIPATLAIAAGVAFVLWGGDLFGPSGTTPAATQSMTAPAAAQPPPPASPPRSAAEALRGYKESAARAAGAASAAPTP